MLSEAMLTVDTVGPSRSDSIPAKRLEMLMVKVTKPQSAAKTRPRMKS